MPERRNLQARGSDDCYTGETAIVGAVVRRARRVDVSFADGQSWAANVFPVERGRSMFELLRVVEGITAKITAYGPDGGKLGTQAISVSACG